MILKNGRQIDGRSVDTLPIGTIQPFLGSVAPVGYLICEGQLVDKVRYSKIYEMCGSTFGEETDTEFYLPDLRGKVIAGYDPDQTEFNVIGKVFGEKTHTLTIDEMPSHNHYVDGAWALDIGASGWGARIDAYTSGYIFRGNSITDRMSNTGGSQAHNNIQPTMALNWIVKVDMLTEMSNVYNGLDSDNTTDSLSAYQGKVLNNKILETNAHIDDLIGNINSVLATLTEVV